MVFSFLFVLKLYYICRGSINYRGGPGGLLLKQTAIVRTFFFTPLEFHTRPDRKTHGSDLLIDVIMITPTEIVNIAVRPRPGPVFCATKL